MTTAAEIISTNADKLLKNLPEEDKDTLEAFIKLKVESGIYGLRFFDNALVGITSILVLVVAITGIILAIQTLNNHSNSNTLRTRLEMAEKSMEVLNRNFESISEDRDAEVLQEVKTKCYAFCGTIP